MKLVKNLSFIQLQNELLGNKARFKSNCQFFPKFDVVGKVTRLYIQNGEVIIEIIIAGSNRQIKIGSNMSNLSFEIV